MVTKNFIKTLNGARQYIYRAITPNVSLSATEYTPDNRFKVGINNQTPLITDEDLYLPIPILSGVVNDNGANQLTGADGGENTTNNTFTFKPGAQQGDNTAQNLNSNDTDELKRWNIDLSVDGTSVDTSKFAGLWLYFTNNVLDVMTTTPIQIRIGNDSTNYFYKNIDKADMIYGWNWIYLGIVEELDEEGTVAGACDYFEIRITTNNATDEWDDGDVIYDLLRSYDESDTFRNYVSGYPQADYNNLEVTKVGFLTTIDAVGYDIDGYGDFNNDSSPLLTSHATISPKSKSDTDEIIFTIKERIIL